MEYSIPRKILHVYFRAVLSNTLDFENKGDMDVIKSYDFRESVKALGEKRDPIFIGK